MSQTTEKPASSRGSRLPRTAGDLMTPNPVSIEASAPLAEVLAFLIDTGYSAAPVIDDAGRPVGVVSRTDIVVYDRARALSPAGVPGYYGHAEPVATSGEDPSEADLPRNALVHASDLMTPAVFSVAPETPSLRVAEDMVRLNVHRLFVVDRAGVLVGVISALDLLRHFCIEQSSTAP